MRAQDNSWHSWLDTVTPQKIDKEAEYSEVHTPGIVSQSAYGACKCFSARGRWLAAAVLCHGILRWLQHPDLSSALAAGFLACRP